MRSVIRLGGMAVVCFVFAPARAADLEAPPGCQDASAIRWFLPGDFKAARAQAEKANRLIMIKGIAFGIDEIGAKCATKGEW